MRRSDSRLFESEDNDHDVFGGRGDDGLNEVVEYPPELTIDDENGNDDDINGNNDDDREDDKGHDESDFSLSFEDHPICEADAGGGTGAVVSVNENETDNIEAATTTTTTTTTTTSTTAIINQQNRSSSHESVFNTAHTQIQSQGKEREMASQKIREAMRS